jgi:hypothetical protein
MYIFAQHGILSIVAHNKKPTMLMVRSPVRADLECYWPHAKIMRTNWADYLYRTVLSREVVAATMAKAITLINYEKVKPAASADRELAYFSAWSTIMDLQDAQGNLRHED